MVSERGHDLDFLLDMDMPAFDSLLGSVVRNDLRRRLDVAGDMRMASQGQQKDWKKFHDAMTRAANSAGHRGQDRVNNDRKEFAARFMGGARSDG